MRVASNGKPCQWHHQDWEPGGGAWCACSWNQAESQNFLQKYNNSTRRAQTLPRPLHYRPVITKYIYTVSQKVYPLMFDNNFGKCGPIFKIFSPTDSGENFLCIYTKTSTSPAICCYTTSWNSKIQICWFWQHPQQTVDMFLRTLLWGLDLTFDSCETDCLETADTDWLTFWSLSDDVSNQQ